MKTRFRQAQCPPVQSLKLWKRANITTILYSMLLTPLLFLGEGAGVMCLAQVANGTGAGNCLNYNGTSDYVDIPPSTSLMITGNATYEAWINLNSINGDRYIFINCINPDNWGMLLGLFTDVPFISVVIEGQQYQLIATNAVNNGEWYHIAGVREGTTLSLYINGILNNTTTVPVGNMRNGWGNSHIGLPQNESGKYYQGTIDEVRIWNTARTETEIRDNMCKKLTGSENGLVGYWRFDEGSGSTANDASGNGNNGTLY